MKLFTPSGTKSSTASKKHPLPPSKFRSKADHPAVPLAPRPPDPLSDKKTNLENWFKALLRCREKRKAEMKIAASFGYILYSIITLSIDKPGSAVDISDGNVLCDLINTVYPGAISPILDCKSREERIKNLGKYCDACLLVFACRFH